MSSLYTMIKKIDKRVIVMVIIILVISLSVFCFKLNGVSLTILKRNRNSVDKNLQMKIDNYPSVYDYSVIRLKKFDVVIYRSGVSVKTPNVYEGSKEQVFQKCFKYCSSFKYNKDNSNPNKLKDVGGNCQALSIMFQYMCEKNGIYCEIVLTENHAYDRVKVDNKFYSVDVTNGSIKEEDNNE